MESSKDRSSRSTQAVLDVFRRVIVNNFVSPSTSIMADCDSELDFMTTFGWVPRTVRASTDVEGPSGMNRNFSLPTGDAIGGKSFFARIPTCLPLTSDFRDHGLVNMGKSRSRQPLILTAHPYIVNVPDD